MNEPKLTSAHVKVIGLDMLGLMENRKIRVNKASFAQVFRARNLNFLGIDCQTRYSTKPNYLSWKGGKWILE